MCILSKIFHIKFDIFMYISGTSVLFRFQHSCIYNLKRKSSLTQEDGASSKKAAKRVRSPTSENATSSRHHTIETRQNSETDETIFKVPTLQGPSISSSALKKEKYELATHTVKVRYLTRKSFF